jgi:hypothetical protein
MEGARDQSNRERQPWRWRQQYRKVEGARKTWRRHRNWQEEWIEHIITLCTYALYLRLTGIHALPLHWSWCFPDKERQKRPKSERKGGKSHRNARSQEEGGGCRRRYPSGGFLMHPSRQDGSVIQQAWPATSEGWCKNCENISHLEQWPNFTSDQFWYWCTSVQKVQKVPGSWRHNSTPEKNWERAASATVSLFEPPGGVAFSYLVIIKSMTDALWRNCAMPKPQRLENPKIYFTK